MRADGRTIFGRPPTPAPTTAGPRVPFIRLGATAVAFPAGTLTRSEAIWSKLNAKPWHAETRALLSLNGMRVGLLKGDAWAEMAQTFADLKGTRLKSTSLPAFPTSPVTVFLQREDFHQTIFTFRLNGTMFGMDYPPGDMLMSVNCFANPAAPSQVAMNVMPLVRSARSRMRQTKTEGRYTFTRMPEIYTFDAAAWQTTITSKDIIVIGPAIGAERASSLGHRFFFRQVDGATFETVLLLTPTVTMINASAPATPLPDPEPRTNGPTSSPRSNEPARPGGAFNSLRR